MKNIVQQCPEMDFLLGQERVAQRLGVATKTMEAWRHRGGGPPFVRIGRLIKYRSQDVEKWIASNVCHSTSEASK
jgi:predicted DNA-binding transcriptional regulator AlpA